MSTLPEGADTTMSVGLRRYLYITAAITGAAVLIVEILGAKMLSPYVGTSHFVWTAQITVTLMALAVGYYFGGWLVDKTANLARLYTCILFAAAYLALSVLLCERVAYEFLGFNLGPGALLSSAILFFVPLTLLAAVCPFLVRILAISFTGLGKQVGRLSAISTAGSVAGTLLIGYVLLPYLPNSITMLITAGLLAALAIVYLIVWGRAESKIPAAVGLGILVACGSVSVYRQSHHKLRAFQELYRVNSNFGMLQVMQTMSGARRYYLNDFLIQNTYDPAEKKSVSLFTYMLQYLTEGYRTNLHDVLCIGLGVGIAPMRFANNGLHVDVVEINPAVVPMAAQFFDLQPAKLNITIGDGRYYVNSTKRRYDAVVLDAFLGDSSPSHLMTRQAFGQMRHILQPGGVLVINSFGDFKAGNDFMIGSLHKTLSAVFKSVKVHATGNGNVFFVASDRDSLNLTIPSLAGTHPEVSIEVDQCLNSIVAPSPNAGIVLTDDYNPVDFYDAKNREQHRRALAMSFRNL